MGYLYVFLYLFLWKVYSELGLSGIDVDFFYVLIILGIC